MVASYLFIPVPQADGAMLPVHGVGWTLNYEMFFYALFCLALVFARRTGILIVAAILLVLVLVNLAMPVPGPLGFWADPIVLEFVFGMLIALAFGPKPRLPWPVVGVIVAAALAVIVATDFSLGGPLRPFGWGLPCAAIVGALLCADAPKRLGRGLRALLFLGDASYALYLTNSVAMTLPRRLLPNLIDPAAWPLVHALLLLAIAVTVAGLVHVLLERPLTRALQQRISAHYRPVSV